MPETVLATNDKERQITWGSRVIPASPARIFELLADPSKHPLIDGSGSVTGARAGKADRITGVGQKFGMKMKLVVPYQMSNTVSDFEENRVIEWHHIGRHKWRYELEPVEGGTRVTESFNYGSALLSPALVLAGYPERHRSSIDRTLERLEEHFA